jgi:hypothetical protein
MRMVTSPPVLPSVVAPDPPFPAAVMSRAGVMEPQPSPDVFVVDWQLTGGAGREW